MRSFSVAVAPLATAFLALGANAAGAATFSYERGSKSPPGPEYWAAIPGTDCDGVSQSPIDLPPPPSFFGCGNLRGSAPMTNYTEPGTCPLDFPTPVFHEGTCTLADLTYLVSGAEIKAVYPSSGCDLPSATINGESYSVLQWHSHARSEHTFAGEHTSGVIHIVHVSDSDPSKLAVIGVMLEADGDENNAALTPYFAKFQEVVDERAESCGIESPGNSTDGDRRLEGFKALAPELRRELSSGEGDSATATPYPLVPPGTAFFTYSGSLTTPPCSEIVTWFVLEDPLLISIKQFATLEMWVLTHLNEDCESDTIASDGGDTYRPTQPLNGRTVRYCKTE